MMLAIDSEAFAAAITKSTENYIRQACLVGGENTYVESETAPLRVPYIQYAAFRLLGYILYPIRFIF
jgi:hypothetical protein